MISVKEFYESSVPDAAVFNESHALIVALCKEILNVGTLRTFNN